MTSSLVGSEMCIRDSLFRCEHGPVVPSGLQLTGSAEPLVFDFTGWAAVSYTHLTLPTICSV
eukprot:1170556-Prorocentrum_lima.AAC.1